MAGAWRLLEDPARDGYRNMAVDEALLDACVAGEEGFPCLRLYGFSTPCLSLGYGQGADSVNLRLCRREGIDLARRPTGGRAMLHDEEASYAVVGRCDRDPFRTSLAELCRRIEGAIVAGLRHVGVQAGIGEGRGEEIVVGSHGFFTSTLSRRRGAFLQHGSIPISLDKNRLRALAGPGAGSEEGGETLEGLAGALGRRICREDLAAAIRQGFQEQLAGSFVKGELSREEHLRAERLRANRYLTASWTFRS